MKRPEAAPFNDSKIQTLKKLVAQGEGSTLEFKRKVSPIKVIKASRKVEEIIKRRQFKKDIQFTYGENEKVLIQYLSFHPTITLKQFIELSKLKRYYASRKLVLLALANVLRVSPNEKGDEYSLMFGN
jgi:hypothetical protein